MRALVIAIDGPAGAGKSTVSKALANELHYELLDTGAMYRAFALIVMNSVESNSKKWLAEISQHELNLAWRNGSTEVRIDGHDVSTEIRSSEVTAKVSHVAAIGEIRAYAVELQRKFIAQAIAAGTGVILEGRDIGTTVVPTADVKFFLTADQHKRAQRRALETNADAAEVLTQLEARDAADSARAASPLMKAIDAIEIDASDLSVAQVVELMLSNIKKISA